MYRTDHTRIGRVLVSFDLQAPHADQGYAQGVSQPLGGADARPQASIAAGPLTDKHRRNIVLVGARTRKEALDGREEFD